MQSYSNTGEGSLSVFLQELVQRHLESVLAANVPGSLPQHTSSGQPLEAPGGGEVEGGCGIRANAIAPGAVEGDRIERVFAGRAQIGGRTVEEVRAEAMAAQSIKAMIDPKDIAALAVFLASDAAKSISGQVLPIDNDRQRA